MRTRIYLTTFIVLGLLLVSAPVVPALDTVDEALCVCADDVLNTGDYVSCVSKMTRRLEAKGIIDAAQRSDLISEASEADIPALQAFCDDQASGDELYGFGTSYSIGNAFCPAFRPLGPQCFVIGDLKLWNNTINTIYLVSNVGGGPRGCQFEILVLDDQDRIVRREDSICPDVVTELELRPGDVLEYFDDEANVPMLALNADPATGYLDGDALRSGRYQILVQWNLSGPENLSGTFDYAGRRLEVKVPVRIGGTPTP